MAADAPSYVPRNADTQLYEALTEGVFAYILTPRQQGKSSLMTRTAQRLRREGVAVAALDLSAQGFNLEASYWYRGLLTQLGRRLGLEDEIDDYDHTHRHLSPLQLWQAVLRDVALTRIPGKIVIFLDEIDIVRALPFSTDELFAAIRACYNARTEDPEYRRLTFCLLGVAAPNELIRNPRLTPFNIGRRIELTDFTPAESARLRSGLGKSDDINERLMARIHYWTNGHPNLTQRLCQAVAQDETATTETAVDQWCERMFFAPEAELRDDNLSYVQQRLLATPDDVSPQAADEHRAALLSLYQRVLTGKPVPDNETDQRAVTLKLSGAVRAEERLLVPRNRIYARVFDHRWTLERMPDAEVQRLKRAYRRAILRTVTIAGIIAAAMTALAATAFWYARRADESQKAAHQEAQRANIEALRANEQNQRANIEALRANEQARLASIEAQNALRQRAEAERRTREVILARAATTTALKQAEAAKREAQRQASLAETRTREALASNEVSVRANRKAAVSQREATERLRDSYLLQADALRFSGRPGHRFGALAALRKAAALSPTPELRQRIRDSAIAALALPADMELTERFPRNPDGSGIVGFDRDNDRSYRSDPKGNLEIRRIRDERLIARLPGSGLPVRYLGRHSPDGRFLAVCYGPPSLEITEPIMVTKVWDVDRKRELLVRGDGTLANKADFSVDSRYMARPEGNSVEVMDLTNPTETKTYTLPIKCQNVRFSPRGDRVAVESDRANIPEIFVIDRESGKRTTVTAPTALDYFAWSPDGSRLAGSCINSHIYIWNAATGAQIMELVGSKNHVMLLAFNHRGDQLLSSGWDNAVRIWDAETGRLLVMAERDCPYSAEFSRDDRFLQMQGYRDLVLYRVAGNRPCRELPGPVAGDGSGLAFSKDGRFMASENSRSVRLWDARIWRPVGDIPAGYSPSLAFLSAGDGIVTYNDKGLLRWPLSPGANGEAGRIGAPVPLRENFSGPYNFALSDDGSLLAVVHSSSPGVPDHAHAFDLSGSRPFLTLPDYYGLHGIVISPDRRWIAAGQWQGRGARVWNARTGKIAADLRVPSRTRVTFTPDARFLVVCSEKEYRFWEVGTWKQGPGIARFSAATGPRSMAFSPDGRIMALVYTDSLVQLRDAHTQAPIASLQTFVPNPEAVIYLQFSPDGTHLAVAYPDRILIWDLREIRNELTANGLQGDFPPFPPAARQDEAARTPLQPFVLDTGIAPRLQMIGTKIRLASATTRLQNAPEDHVALNELAWIRADGPEELRDPAKAVAAAEKAVALAPKEFTYINTLGVAYYRAGQYDRALTTLQKSLERSGGQADAYDLFFLAMTRQKMGRLDAARGDYQRAVQWRTTHRDGPLIDNEELDEIQREAAETLGISL